MARPPSPPMIFYYPKCKHCGASTTDNTVHKCKHCGTAREMVPTPNARTSEIRRDGGIDASDIVAGAIILDAIL